MKVGLIRCQQTEDVCPGSTDFKVMREKSAAFEGIDEEINVVGMTSCGGCPSKKATFRAKEMTARGADTIVFASCISRGTPIGFPCPFAKKIQDSVRMAVGENVRIIDYTH